MPKPENVIPHKWKKGQTGNPNGRPRKLPELKELLANVLGEEKDGKTRAERIIEAACKKAEKGDIRAGEWLFDRGWGKAAVNVDLTGEVNVNTVIRPKPVE